MTASECIPHISHIILQHYLILCKYPISLFVSYNTYPNINNTLKGFYSYELFKELLLFQPLKVSFSQKKPP